MFPRNHNAERSYVEVCCVLEERFGGYRTEYGLIAAGISVAIVAVVNGLGTQAQCEVQRRLDPAQISVKSFLV